jgi:SET domain-containing protein
MRVDRSNAIDASRSLKTFGRYANDARGTSRKEGLINNAEYVSEGKRCFIEAIKDIPAGGEILVNYGKDYWKVFG